MRIKVEHWFEIGRWKAVADSGIWPFYKYRIEVTGPSLKSVLFQLANKLQFLDK